jgi:hypothetical protein
MQPEAMLNLLGLMLRGVTFLDHGTINTLGWIVFGIGLVIITVMWIHSQVCDQRLLGLTVLIAAIFVPHLHIHDLTILIFPLLFAITDDTRRISPQMIAVLFGASFVFITGLVVEPLYFILPYGIYIALTWRLATGNSIDRKPVNLT